MDSVYCCLSFDDFEDYVNPNSPVYRNYVCLSCLILNLLSVWGFLLSILSSGFGFNHGHSHWKWGHLVVFGAVQSTATGILHAFEMLLVLDCAPSGKEGVFYIWYGWMRAAGLCVGFTVGSVVLGLIRASFRATFCIAIAGIVVLLFRNISDVGGAVAAEHINVRRSSDVPGLDSKESACI
ncbi:60S ribosomal protein L7a [Spatholobus suberectus]|nr:60S ribosomal protein L7a [Spatholobus suberectus]